MALFLEKGDPMQFDLYFLKKGILLGGVLSLAYSCSNVENPPGGISNEMSRAVASVGVSSPTLYSSTSSWVGQKRPIHC